MKLHTLHLEAKMKLGNKIDKAVQTQGLDLVPSWLVSIYKKSGIQAVAVSEGLLKK